MKITLLVNGYFEEEFLEEAFLFYKKRIQHYISIDFVEIPAPKNTKSMTKEMIREKEGELTEKNIVQGDYVVLLDERGKEYRSVEFANYIQDKMNRSIRNLVFICGGPYGFSEKIIKQANEKLSLSRMTFSHEMVRVFFAEQLYRAFAILRNEPYHHE